MEAGPKTVGLSNSCAHEVLKLLRIWCIDAINIACRERRNIGAAVDNMIGPSWKRQCHLLYWEADAVITACRLSLILGVPYKPPLSLLQIPPAQTLEFHIAETVAALFAANLSEEQVETQLAGVTVALAAMRIANASTLMEVTIKRILNA